MDDRGQRLSCVLELRDGAGPLGRQLHGGSGRVCEHGALREPERDLERRVAQRPGQSAAELSRRRMLELQHEVADARPREPRPQQPRHEHERERE